MGKPDSTVIFRTRLHYGPPLFGYTLALALVAITGTARIALMADGDSRAPFVLFYPAIAATSFLGGVGPGLLAILAGGVFAFRLFPQFPAPLSWIALAILGPLLVSGFAHLREISERSKAVARECARFRYISDHVSDWIFLTGESGAIQFANETACVQLGFAADELTGRAIEDIAPAWQRKGLRDLLDQSRAGKSVPSQVVFERRDGSVAYVEVGCTAVQTGAEVVIHVAARDITDRKLLDLKLREARQWENLRVLAGGVAHDFNNLLTSMMGNAALAREALPKQHLAAGLLENVERAGDRSAELVRMMLATAGYGSPNHQMLRMDQLLQRVLEAHWIPGNVRLISSVADVQYYGDGESLEMLLWSLIANAVESYGESPGEVNVAMWSAAMTAHVPGSFDEGETGSRECLAIAVEDHGCGMDGEVLEKAFNPFYSTKFTGRGLGLPAVRGIVRAHSGRLWLKTSPGEGTRVEAWLPTSLGG